MADKKLKAKELKRKNVVEGLKRIEDFLKKYDPTQHAREVGLRLERLEKLMEVFEAVQSEYELLDETEEFMKGNLECRAKIEEQYFRVKAGLLTRMPEVATPLSSAVSSMNVQPPTSSPLSNVKLPTITLPEFTGDFNDWLTFHDTFVSMIHTSNEISCVQKFHYLRAALKGEAANLIQSITITANNYAVAWETLVQRYSNKILLRKKHIRALLKYPKIPNHSVEALHKIVDEFQRHTKVLEQLGEPIAQYSSILMEILEDKLDDASLAAWEESISSDQQPTYEKMIEYLQKRARVLETILINRPNPSSLLSKPAAGSSGSKKHYHPRLNINAAVTDGASGKIFPMCPACEKQKHPLVDCAVFNGMNVAARLKVVYDKRLCSNCFRNDHYARRCRSKFSCKHCSKRHHSMIHPGPAENRQADADIRNQMTMPSCENQQPSPNPMVSAVAAAVPTIDTYTSLVLANPAVKVTHTNVLLSTVVLLVVDPYGQEHVARALLDSGSQPNAISERLCQQLHLARRPINIPISGIDGTVTNAKHQVQAEIRSRVFPFQQTLDFLVLRRVTCDTPPVSFNTSCWKIPETLPLADPEFNVTHRIDMILGAAQFFDFIREGKVRLAVNLPMLIETVFGWIVSGIVKETNEAERIPVACHVATVTPVDQLLERFWRVEEINGSNFSLDEQRCEELFRETVSRDADGRYIVKMPKQPQYEKMIGASKTSAFQRFRWLERMLEKKKELKSQYHDFMREYLALGHMREVPVDDDCRLLECYLPHHPVVKESSSTTKVRVVFDGSAKTSTGKSLNDSLLVGPVVQDDIVTIIVRFRQFPVALVADAEKMYRQVWMNPIDRRLQRIVFRFDISQPIKIYELATVTYGLAPSSFLATRTLLQLVNDEGAAYPNASKAVKKNIYMDDYIGGEFSIEAAIQLQSELMQLMQKGGFRLRKWVSNSPDVLAKIPQELLGTQSALKFDQDETIKTLGILWEPEADVFRFNVSVSLESREATKRSILSAIAQLFDPLGLVSPVIVQAKIMMQHLWLLSLNWDDQVTPEMQRKWDRFCQQLPQLSDFRIDRCAFMSHLNNVEIHTFADASDAAYGACVYVRSEATDGSIKVSLLASKSRVAPLKCLSIPRLELCAALVGARLYEKLILALDVPIKASHFWSDSTVVLQWMKSPPRTWRTFVANRISEIQSTTHGSKWMHVAGEENPADLVSRGVSANELVTSDKWKYGPSWLRKPKSSWPSQVYEAIDFPVEELEQKKTAILATITASPNSLFLRYSRYLRLLNLVGFVLRFARNARCKPENRYRGKVLDAAEIMAAKLVLSKLVQKESFPDELKLLQLGKRVSSKSKLRLMNPYLDADGLIRVGGRLQRSREAFDVLHPIVLPGFHPFTRLVIKHHHEKLVHSGISTTLAVVRDEFWPLSGRRAVTSVLRKCFRCCRATPHPIEQPIGQLPAARVTAGEAFECTGVDYCGPIYLKPAQRKAPSRKAYICVLICLSTKAVHLELVGDLSTTTFLMALNRFIWRRNKPKHIYSDNGTNFIGAKNALHQLYCMLQPGSAQDNIKQNLAQDGIQWHLIPPRAPNFGGLWEAAVKVAKKQLVRQLGDALLTYEELVTVLVSIEGSMNSRPLMPLSDDPNDCRALTPSHFLVRNMIRPLPEPDVRNIPLNRLGQYERLQSYSQRFWHQWRSEYLKELQVLYKTNPKQFKIDVGSIVILKDDALPPARWPLARVVDTHPGPDGITRVVTLRTSGGEFKRAVSKICGLPCAED
ncbi:uncharacterized protein LOC129773856 [Toxorhynchites rutilus septentrionalis]|uniref:uncharacterized protein LOC129773856 n=1 Tax=Toxorhynchites rutilus septentrionalis TaxID=329112 RepID=UPI002479CB30|nr:uncharacterized protein LOC129773856 [Toxorhynchites rutilus septentrionalis]